MISKSTAGKFVSLFTFSLIGLRYLASIE
ncbi:hypothetical protein YPPY46_1034, partial [Yersinia pestis PY-46]